MGVGFMCQRGRGEHPPQEVEMYAPYKPLHTRPIVPDMMVNPPEPTDEEWERNNRNSMREEAIDALGTAISRLNELDDTDSISYLEIVLDNLQQGMED